LEVLRSGNCCRAVSVMMLHRINCREVICLLSLAEWRHIITSAKVVVIVAVCLSVCALDNTKCYCQNWTKLRGIMVYFGSLKKWSCIVHTGPASEPAPEYCVHFLNFRTRIFVNISGVCGHLNSTMGFQFCFILRLNQSRQIPRF